MIEQETVVEQVDREAAAALVCWQREATDRWQSETHGSLSAQQFFVADFSRAIMQGIWDEHPVVQTFARHRASSTPEAAVAGEVERLRERIGREAKDWRHNAYTRAMLAEMHDRLAVLAQGGGVHG